MALELGEKVKLLEEYIQILKQDLLFLMAERKRKPESTVAPEIITIKHAFDYGAHSRKPDSRRAQP